MKPAAAQLPVEKSLQDMKSIRLWLMADSATAAAVTLCEKHGGRYVAITWLTPKAWQHVELTPEDFVLAEAWNDPKDPDGRLDLDRIKGVEIKDLSQIYGASYSRQNHFVVNEHSGPQRLFVDDFEISAESPSWFHGNSPFQIDAFDHPQLRWHTWGGADLRLDESHAVMDSNALMAGYQQMEDRFVPLFHVLRPMDFAEATHLAFDIASTKDAHILVGLAEPITIGTSFSVDVEVKGGKPEHNVVKLSAFEHRDQSAPYASARLAHAKLKYLLIEDITGQFTHKTAENTLRISNIELVKTSPTGR